MAYWELGDVMPMEMPEGEILQYTDDPEALARATYAATGMGMGVGDVGGWLKEHAVHLVAGFAAGYLAARQLGKRSYSAGASFAMNPRKKRKKSRKGGKR